MIMDGRNVIRVYNTQWASSQMACVNKLGA